MVAVVLVGCSGIERPTLAPPATPRAIELGWTERFRAAGLVLSVERLVIRDDGWSAEVAVENRSRDSYRLEPAASLVLLDTASRRELRALTGGLQTAPPSLMPDAVAPRPPPELAPGARWRATISGSAVLREGSVLRVLFGPYGRVTSPRLRETPADALWVTDHAVRL